MRGPRVRFAPSPTGFFHVGSARTALFNWFVARHDPNGVFVLRIEDTDDTRNRDEWVDGIVSAMQWLGMHADVGPYRQSDHKDEHFGAVTQLHAAGWIYMCDCTTDMVQARKGEDKTPGYDGFCRERALSPGPGAAYRFKVPREGTTVVTDEVRGEVVFANENIEDFVVAKPSGAVLFALSNVVDDRRDEITHVIRGEEHLPNTPKQILMWRALDEVTGTEMTVPSFAHLPVLVNEQRKKLSKRRDPVAVEMYRDQGYLPEAFANYLSLLGWSPRGDVEKVSLDVSVAQFRLGDVSHSPAFFDVKKLAHLNGEYIRDLSADEFIERSAPWVRPSSTSWHPSDQEPAWRAEQFDAEVYSRIAPLVQERVATMGEVPGMVEFLFLDEAPFNEADFAKAIGVDHLAHEVLVRAAAAFADVSWDAAALHAAAVHIGAELDVNLRKAQAPIRCAVTGRNVGPPLFESLELLGREATITRLSRALARARQ